MEKNRKKVTGSCKLQQIRGTQIVGPQKVWIAAVELVVLQILEKFKVARKSVRIALYSSKSAGHCVGRIVIRTSELCSRVTPGPKYTPMRL